MKAKTTILLAVGCLAAGIVLGGAAYRSLISDPVEHQLKLEAACSRCMITLSALWELRRGHTTEALSSLEASQDYAVEEMKNMLASAGDIERMGTSRLIRNARSYRLKYPAPPASKNSAPPMWDGFGSPGAPSPASKTEDESKSN